MKKTIVYGDDAKKRLFAGIQKIAKGVKVTLGPSGRNVLIRNGSGDKKPFASKDGVTVAAQFSSDDYIEQQAIEAVQDAANLADNKAGDGTTTATILVEAIFELGMEVAKENGINLIDLKRGIDLGVMHIVDELKKLSIECKTDLEQLKQVALISSNNDEIIANVVLDAFKVAGNQGVVNIKRSRTSETFLTTIEGMNLSTGFLSQYFINDFENEIVNFENPYVYMTNEKITSITTNFDILLGAVHQKDVPLVIICKDMDPAVLGMLIDNVSKGTLRVCVCKAPGFGEQQNEELIDLGTLLGKNPFLEHDGIAFNEIEVPMLIENGEVQYDNNNNPIVNSEFLLDYLPQSEGITITKNNISVKGPLYTNDDDLKVIENSKALRVEYLRKQLEKQKTVYEQSAIQTRISRLAQGIAYINIGAISDIEYDEKQHRIQDALYAVKSASEEGIIPGGGTALMFVSKMKPKNCSNYSVQQGMNIIFSAIEEPFNQILKNVGLEVEDITIETIKNKFNIGIDARTQKPCDDMIGEGIIDPVKVTRVALENAASIAGMLLTTDCVIVDNRVYENNNAKTLGEY